MEENPYREYAPSATLAPHIECFWTRAAAPSSAAEHRILPDGALDFVFVLGDESAMGATAVGTMTRALVIRPDAPRAFIGVRFHPGQATAFLPLPAAELTDLTVPLGELWSEGTRAHDEVLSARSDEERVRTLAGALERGIRRERAGPPAVGAAVAELVNSGGRLDVSTLGPSLGITRQHLARLFARHVGVSPKLFARVVRARRVLSRLEREGTRANWAGLAAEAGYYDQAHLIADFRALTGLTPGAWSSDR